MRRKDREITGRENIEPILQACKVCRVAMTGTDGWPYVIPMNFGYTWDEDGLTLYFHGGVKGKKIDSLRADPRVCFELDCEEGLTGEGDLACRYSYAFSSIVGYGRVEFAEDNEEKRQGLDVIMQHQTGKGGWTYTDAALSVTERSRLRPRARRRRDEHEAYRDQNSGRRAGGAAGGSGRADLAESAGGCTASAGAGGDRSAGAGGAAGHHSDPVRGGRYCGAHAACRGCVERRSV